MSNKHLDQGIHFMSKKGQHKKKGSGCTNIVDTSNVSGSSFREGFQEGFTGEFNEKEKDQLTKGGEKIDVVLQCSNKIWDIHALIPIIKAAGGIVSTWRNENAKKAGNIICSSNKILHKKILKIWK